MDNFVRDLRYSLEYNQQQQQQQQQQAGGNYHNNRPVVRETRSNNGYINNNNHINNQQQRSWSRADANQVITFYFKTPASFHYNISVNSMFEIIVPMVYACYMCMRAIAVC